MEARRKRRIVDNGIIDWVMVRNRMATIASNNARQVALSVSRLASELRFRGVDGLHDRARLREGSVKRAGRRRLNGSGRGGSTDLSDPGLDRRDITEDIHRPNYRRFESSP